MELRDYQKRAVIDLRNSFKANNKNVLFVLPTGGGKTFTFTWMAKSAQAKGLRVWVLAHRDSLIRQASAAFSQFEIDHGIIKAGYPKTDSDVQICSVQTVVNRLDAVAAPDLIIIDEAHHAVAGQWQKVIDHYPSAFVLGVTATPCRTDGRGLSDVFDIMIEGPSIQDLIGMGFLVTPELYAPPMKVDLSGVSTSMGDFNKKEVAVAMDKPHITGDAVQHYRDLCDGVPAVAFCINVQHAHNVAAEFRAAGYSAEAIDGTMHIDHINQVLADLGSGKVQVVASCDLISEGTDIPKIGCAILLRKTQSKSLYLQQVGRALRPAEGKDYAIILDHVGNWKQHGLPTDEQSWTLKGKKKRKKKEEEETIKTTQCSTCFFVFEYDPSMPECPACASPIKRGKRKRSMEGDKDIELVEVTEAKKKEKKLQEWACETLEDWYALAKQRGYKPGWAWYRWQSQKKNTLRINKKIDNFRYFNKWIKSFYDHNEIDYEGFKKMWNNALPDKSGNIKLNIGNVDFIFSYLYTIENIYYFKYERYELTNIRATT